MLLMCMLSLNILFEEKKEREWVLCTKCGEGRKRQAISFSGNEEGRKRKRKYMS